MTDDLGEEIDAFARAMNAAKAYAARVRVPAQDAAGIVDTYLKAYAEAKDQHRKETS